MIAFWALNSLEKTFVTGDILGRLEPATWLLLCLGTFSISSVFFMANAFEDYMPIVLCQILFQKVANSF